MSESEPNYTLGPEEVRFDLTESDIARYLHQVKPSGYRCLMCGSSDVGPIMRSSTGGEEARAYPNTTTPEAYIATPASRRMHVCAAGNYEIVCGNCGHVSGFNAGMVAGRTALWKRREAGE